MLDTIYEKEQNKESFAEKYEAVIKLNPGIWHKNSRTEELVHCYDREDIDAKMMDYASMDCLFEMTVSYDPATKDESGFWDDLYVSRELNWKDCPPMGSRFDGLYLSYAIHILWDHHEWAFQDIARINNIYVYVEVQYSGGERMF